MRLKSLVSVFPRLVAPFALGTILFSLPGYAQVTADLVAAPGIPAGNNFAPHTPSGMVIIGSNVWMGTTVRGFTERTKLMMSAT